MALPVLLELKQLACERDERFLFAHLTERFSAGQVVQVLGPNGSGKTTLLRVLAGVSRDYHGEIRWGGELVNRVSWEFAKDLLYLGHLAGIKKSLTPLENLRWYAALQGGVSEEALTSALAAVNLSGFEHTPCFHLSAGQTRRVALARLSFSSARLWLLDEPFTALDKAGIADLEARIAAHAAAGGLVLLTSHQDVHLPHLRTLNLADFVDFSTVPHDEWESSTHG